MIWIVVLLLAIIGIFWIVHRMDSKKNHDDHRRTAQLVQEAKERWPLMPLSLSLDMLWEETYKQLLVAKRRGDDIDGFIRDHILIANERIRIVREAVERESEYRIKAVRKTPTREMLDQI